MPNKPIKKTGKSHWRESRKEAGNLNQKAGPMQDIKRRRLKQAEELDHIMEEVEASLDKDDIPRCRLCGVEITMTDVVTWASLCIQCEAEPVPEFEDTVDDHLSLPEFPKSSGRVLEQDFTDDDGDN